MTETPFWETSYRDDNAATFGKGPTRDVKELWHRFDPAWSVLDVGCGEGRNSLFLASKGMSVDAFDISESGIEKLKRLAEKRGVEVNAWVQDLTTFRFQKTYDLILSNGVLHLVERQEWQDFIARAREHTNPGGMNLIGIFTNRLPATPDNAPFTKALFNEDDLEKLYSDWEILKSDNYEFEDEHPGGIRHRHAAGHIAARKPG